MTKIVAWVLAGATAAALLGSLAGCSSTDGCRSCRRQVAGPPSPPPAAATGVAAAPARVPYGGQRQCPVTGEELGSMGDPVAVTVSGQTVYVCCKGCAKRAAADPATSLAAVEADRAGL